MIVLLLPSRGRPDNVKRLVESLHTTTEGEWRMVIAQDDDDPTLGDYPSESGRLIYLFGQRRLLSIYWNDCYERALKQWGDDPDTVYMHAADDIVFRTLGWDQIVADAFPDDGITFVHGHYFSSDCNDAWLTDVADLLGRRVYIPIVTEHLHFAFGKAEVDLTTQERLARHEADDVTSLWHKLAPERYGDAAKLRAVMHG